MMHRLHLLVPFVLLASACAPTIYNFDATPSTICKGGSSTLHWRATHRGSISATPPNDSPGSVFSEGSSVVTPQASGSYHLESTNIILSSGRDVRVEVTECAAKAAPPAPAAAPAGPSAPATAPPAPAMTPPPAPPK